MRYGRTVHPNPKPIKEGINEARTHTYRVRSEAAHHAEGLDVEKRRDHGGSKVVIVEEGGHAAPSVTLEKGDVPVLK